MTISGMPSNQGNGQVMAFTAGDTEVLSFTMTMIVPAKPANTQTLFLWPGLQLSSSGGINGFGVLQPVLTWGSSCNGNQTSDQKGWWISGQYVYYGNGFGAKCETEDIMAVESGDKLDIEFVLNGMVWTQTIKNQRDGKTVKFDRDLKGQKQTASMWIIEAPTSNKPTDDVIFTHSVIKMRRSQPQTCMPKNKGASDYVSPVRASAGGKTCCIDKFILRAAGTPRRRRPTNPDEQNDHAYHSSKHQYAQAYSDPRLVFDNLDAVDSLSKGRFDRDGRDGHCKRCEHAICERGEHRLDHRSRQQRQRRNGWLAGAHHEQRARSGRCRSNCCHGHRRCGQHCR